MRFIRRIFRLLPAIVLMSGFACAAAGQQEKPVDPDSLAGGSRPFGLVINGFAAGDFNYNFNTDENSFESSTLAVSLFRALSDRVSFFGQVTVHKEKPSPPWKRPGPQGSGLWLPISPRRSSFATDIDNLQVSWAADPGHGLSIIFGKFDSPLAIERDDAPLNFQATPSFVFDFARPVKFSSASGSPRERGPVSCFARLPRPFWISSDSGALTSLPTSGRSSARSRWAVDSRWGSAISSCSSSRWSRCGYPERRTLMRKLLLTLAALLFPLMLAAHITPNVSLVARGEFLKQGLPGATRFFEKEMMISRADGAVRRVAVTDIGSEPVVWVRPLIDGGGMDAFEGLAAGAAPDPSRVAPQVNGSMSRYYARIIADGVARAQAVERVVLQAGKS